MIGFQKMPRPSNASALTPNTTRNDWSLRATIASPAGSSKYITLIMRR